MGHPDPIDGGNEIKIFNSRSLVLNDMDSWVLLLDASSWTMVICSFFFFEQSTCDGIVYFVLKLKNLRIHT